jgi:hypothetical protein
MSSPLDSLSTNWVTLGRKCDSQFKPRENPNNEEKLSFCSSMLLVIAGMMDATLYGGEYTLDLSGELLNAEKNFTGFLNLLEDFLKKPPSPDDIPIYDVDMIAATPGCPNPNSKSLGAYNSFIQILRNDKVLYADLIRKIN